MIRAFLSLRTPRPDTVVDCAMLRKQAEPVIDDIGAASAASRINEWRLLSSDDMGAANGISSLGGC